MSALDEVAAIVADGAGLTVVELRELDLHFTRWAFWLLLVFLTHFVGYLVLRGYTVYRRRALAGP